MTLIVYPFRPQPGDLEDITEIMMDFDAITAVVNGNIDASNIKAGSIGSDQLAPGAMTLTVPTGSFLPFGGDAAPAGFLLCDGTQYPVANYNALHAVIGYKYGGSGGNFNVPNLKGNTLVGVDAAQAEFTPVGKAGGKKTAPLTTAHMPQHNHGGQVDARGDHFHGFPAGVTPWTSSPAVPGWSLPGIIGCLNGSQVNSPMDAIYLARTGDGGTHQHNINQEGGGQEHANLQPYVTCNYIIKT